jgi:hypothetical protein
MSFLGLATTSPIVAMSLVDTSRYQVVVWCDTPKTLSFYERWLRRTSTKKAVLFIFGASNLSKVIPNKHRFSTIVVSDDAQNLRIMQEKSNLRICDLQVKNGIDHPKVLTATEFMDMVSVDGIPEDLLVQEVTNAFKRTASVLETTSRLPKPVAPISESALQKNLLQVTKAVGGDTAFITQGFARYLLRLSTRNELTQTVTKKLPAHVRDHWEHIVDIAKSQVGDKIATVFHTLCCAKDQDLRVGHLVAKYGLQSYSGDVLFFTAILPPSPSYVFIDDFVPLTDASTPSVTVSRA